jgi:hypothetical protein
MIFRSISGLSLPAGTYRLHIVVTISGVRYPHTTGSVNI